jgi:hypothetical protein
VLQCIAAVTLVAAALLTEYLGSSLTPVKYSAEVGVVPAHLSHCAYIVPRSTDNIYRGAPTREATCFFGSRDSHQKAYAAAWVAIGLSIAVLLWTALTGRGMRVAVRYR